MKRIVSFLIGIFILECLALPYMAFAVAVQGVLERPAIKVNNPEKCVLVDVAFMDGRLVAVGERGIIIYSDDSGDTWQQADVPVSVTITAVYFVDPQRGWAVGHGGVVLHTTDGGKTWNRQLEGVAAARLALDAAQAYADRAGADDEAAQTLLWNVELLVEDGPDKPFLDLYFRNDREGFIIGSYGYIFRTEDGGDTWTCLMDRMDNPDGLNLYAIHVVDNTLYIVGEQGLFFISKDNGNSFQRIETPYEGTYFDMAVSPNGEIVLAGLLGRAYWSDDQGLSFNRSEVSEEVSFTVVERLADGTLIFANQGGMLLESRDGGRTIQAIEELRLAPISSLVPMGDNTIMTVGYGGAIRVQLPSSGLNEKGGQP